MHRVVGTILAVAGLVVSAAGTSIQAQGVTTSAVSGQVTDSAGHPLKGTQVVATHTPSGTTYVGQSGDDGRFTIPGMRVGGPYSVRATYIGYRPQVQDSIYLTLGVTADANFRLTAAAVQLEAITVTGQADPVFSSERTGAATAVPTVAIKQLPTVSRRVEDLLRLTPQYENGANGFSFAGQLNLLIT